MPLGVHRPRLEKNVEKRRTETLGLHRALTVAECYGRQVEREGRNLIPTLEREAEKQRGDDPQDKEARRRERGEATAGAAGDGSC